MTEWETHVMAPPRRAMKALPAAQSEVQRRQQDAAEAASWEAFAGAYGTTTGRG